MFIDGCKSILLSKIDQESALHSIEDEVRGEYRRHWFKSFSASEKRITQIEIGRHKQCGLGDS
jgi:hypothetical protein